MKYAFEFITSETGMVTKVYDDLAVAKSVRRHIWKTQIRNRFEFGASLLEDYLLNDDGTLFSWDDYPDTVHWDFVREALVAEEIEKRARKEAVA